MMHFLEQLAAIKSHAEQAEEAIADEAEGRFLFHVGRIKMLSDRLESAASDM